MTSVYRFDTYQLHIISLKFIFQNRTIKQLKQKYVMFFKMHLLSYVHLFICMTCFRGLNFVTANFQHMFFKQTVFQWLYLAYIQTVYYTGCKKLHNYLKTTKLRKRETKLSIRFSLEGSQVETYLQKNRWTVLLYLCFQNKGLMKMANHWL